MATGPSEDNFLQLPGVDIQLWCGATDPDPKGHRRHTLGGSPCALQITLTCDVAPSRGASWSPFGQPHV